MPRASASCRRLRRSGASSCVGRAIRKPSSASTGCTFRRTRPLGRFRIDSADTLIRVSCRRCVAHRRCVDGTTGDFAHAISQLRTNAAPRRLWLRATENRTHSRHYAAHRSHAKAILACLPNRERQETPETRKTIGRQGRRSRSRSRSPRRDHARVGSRSRLTARTRTHANTSPITASAIVIGKTYQYCAGRSSVITAYALLGMSRAT